MHKISIIFASSNFNKHLKNNNMNTIQLVRNGIQIIATDGQMYIDGRWNLSSIKNAVMQRNNRFRLNFPHKVATAFIYKGKTYSV